MISETKVCLRHRKMGNSLPLGSWDRTYSLVKTRHSSFVLANGADFLPFALPSPSRNTDQCAERRLRRVAISALIRNAFADSPRHHPLVLVFTEPPRRRWSSGFLRELFRVIFTLGLCYLCVTTGALDRPYRCIRRNDRGCSRDAAPFL